MNDHITRNFRGEIERNQDYQNVPNHDCFVFVVDINVDMSLIPIGNAGDCFDKISWISRSYRLLAGGEREAWIGRKYVPARSKWRS